MKKANQEGGGNKVLAFFKRNIYFVLIIVCVLAIGTMITIAAVNGSQDENPPVNGDLNDDDSNVNGDVERRPRLLLSARCSPIILSISASAIPNSYSIPRCSTGRHTKAWICSRLQEAKCIVRLTAR